MKKLQSFLALLLCLCLLTGCFGAPTEPESTASVPESTSSTTTQATEPPWHGYVDPKTQYTYFYSEGRELEWEEDILYFANSLISEHPMLRNRAFVIDLPNYATDAGNFYDEAFFQTFVEQINLLIPEVASLTDDEIIYRLQYIIALFEDAHTRLQWAGSEYFPVLFMPFQENDETVFYAVMIEKTHKEALYARLDAINGYSVAQIREMIRPYAPVETEAGLTDDMGRAGLGLDYLSRVSMLEAAGVIPIGAEEAVYTLTGPDGTVYTLELSSSAEDYRWAGHSYLLTYSTPYMHRELNFWFMENLFENTLYIRISSFRETEKHRYKDFADKLSQAYRAHGSYDKIIVDLRDNGGGSEGTAFDAMVKEFSRFQCEEFYVLINGGSYSKSAIFAGELVARRGDVILAGTPAGEAAGFFAGLYYGSFIMPNCGIEISIPTKYYQPFPKGEEDLILLDLVIYPTLEDYINLDDTLLEAIGNS